MADFRKWILAFAALTMLVGLVPTASAQPFTCNASAAVPPLLRQEGLTELTGDIILTCTNVSGAPISLLATGGAVPVANFTVFYNTAVTSRILNTDNNLSEALLILNDITPTAGNTCTTASGCGAYIGAPTSGTAALTRTAFQGVVSGNSVSFIGVPIAPPGTAGGPGVVAGGTGTCPASATNGCVTSFSYRLTNVRVNANGVTGGVLVNGQPVGGIAGSVVGLVTITGPTSVGVPNPQQVTGFVQTSMQFSASPSTNTFGQCNAITRTTSQGWLRFRELFPTAFKMRGDATQTTVGTIYQTESGLVVPSLTGSTTNISGGSVTSVAGLADFGTRLKAVFTGIPANVSLYVTTRNIVNGGASTWSQQAAGVSTTAAIAQLVTSETALSAVGTIPTASSTNTDFRDPNGNATITATQITADASGRYVATWEVTGANPNSSDNYDFGWYFAASAGRAGITSSGPGTVIGSYAPTFSTTGSTATAYATASGSLPIPRFVDNSATPTAIITVNVCRTNLLFPYVTTVAGWDTGIAISNTSIDIFGNTGQPNTACALTFFGDGLPATGGTGAGAFVNPVPLTVAAGKTNPKLVSELVGRNFSGYIIAQCQFQFAHGFAFIGSFGSGDAATAMGYLALIIPDRVDNTRTSSITVTNSGLGEVLGQ